MHRILFAAIALGAAPLSAHSQTPTPAATTTGTAVATGTPLPANTMITCANGIKLTFVPGTNPILTAEATDGTVPPGLAAAAVHTVRFIDKNGRDVDPATIRPTERLQPLGGSGPNGLILQKIMVDRD